MRYKLILYISFFLITIQSIRSQCFNNAYANGYPNTVEICLGDSVVLTSNGNCPSYLMNNDFNLGNAGTGWQATNQAMFSNPCTPHSPDGTTYMWMGATSTAPRILTTIPFDVSMGGTISFEMRYSVQSAASPCEGPDQYDEGISVQYSINNGTTWVTMVYFAPNGDILTSTPTATTPGASGQTPFTVWNTFTYPIPVAAQTTATRFRWAQLSSTSEVYDHWGLDNVTIGVPPPNIQVWWAHGPTVANPPVVSPTTTTTYTVYVTDQTDTAQGSVEVIVHQPPTMQINNLAALHCINGDSSLMTGNPTGGVFSGAGVVGDTFFPALSGLGTHTITYDYHIIGNSIGNITVFEDDFFTDKGWTGYGTGGWTRGAAAVASGCSGSLGPGVDHTPTTTDNFIIGNYLGACYPNSMAANNYLTSPVFNCTGVTDVELEFWRWAGCESSSYDKIGIQVYDGANWTTIWQNSASFSDASWTQQIYDVSAQANNNANFRVRFYIGPTDGSVSYIGWNIDDFILRGVGPVTDTLCSFSTTATTQVVEAPTAEFILPDTICINEPVIITFTGIATANATYNWDFNGGTIISGNGAGPYSVSWNTDGTKSVSLSVIENGCYSTVFQDTIIVLPLTNPLCACWTPAVSIIAQDSICINTSLNLTSNGLASYVYDWDFAGGNVISGTANGPYNINWSTPGTYTIDLTVTEGNCYPFDTSFTVIIKPLPQITLVATDENCDKGNGSVISTATPGSIFQWSNGAATPDLINISAGTYTVTVSDGMCTNTSSISVINIPGPTAAFSINSNTQNVTDANFTFTDLSLGATTWQWNFGDNNVSFMQNPSHTYETSGTFTVSLTVEDVNDCVDSAERDVLVMDLYTIYLPSAFTPDGDGINDFFGPLGINIDNNYYKMYIFDRWGKIIFYTNDVNKHWDGIITGSSSKEKIPGVYTYRILYREMNGKDKKILGTVTLILP
ncbi:MAG: PKD domain-containing protein [Bacteroidales bacterium]|nr:PKD domain-containing protein [Bacteroidales bacterium]